MAPRPMPKRGACPAERREAILDAATAIFLERGYAGATTDLLIERIGGSKETVYSHFGSKAGLFEAVMWRNGSLIVEQMNALQDDRPVAEALGAFGRGYLTTILTPQKLALLRLAIGEYAGHGEIGTMFWRLGPETVTARLREYLADRRARGLLAVTEPQRAAAHFMACLRGEFHFRALLDPTYVIDAEAIARHVDFCVEAFLRLCAPR